MRVKVSGILNMEIAGKIMGLKERGGYLVMTVETNVGSVNAASVKAALTHKDLVDVVKLLVKPANLRYILFGFGKPKVLASSPFE